MSAEETLLGLDRKLDKILADNEALRSVNRELSTENRKIKNEIRTLRMRLRGTMPDGKVRGPYRKKACPTSLVPHVSDSTAPSPRSSIAPERAA